MYGLRTIMYILLIHNKGTANMPSFLYYAYDHEVYPEHLTHTRYADARYSCWYFRSGSLTLQAGGRTFRVAPGSWVLCPPLTLRSHWFGH